MIPTPTYDYARLATRLVSGERSPGAHVAKGFLAGLIGGLVATGVKHFAERYIATEAPDDEQAAGSLADKTAAALADRGLTPRQQAAAEAGLPWLFGGLIGGAYGAATELVPELKEGYGLAFGAAVYGVMHEGVLPAADIEAPHAEKDPAEERGELFSHLVYGVVTELTRTLVRPRV